jgi:hypothetical protein
MAWSKLGASARVGLVVLGLAFAALAAVFVLHWAPEWLAQPGLSRKDRAEDVGRTRTAILATLAGMIAVAGAIFTGLSYRLNRAGQITERFTRAIDQLGESKPDVCLGGVYALERIARDSKDDHPQVVEVLTAFVREHARYEPDRSRAATTSGEEGQGDEAAQPGEAPRMATDVQAAMDVLARREISQDRPNHRLNLAHTDLRRLVLDAEEGGHLEGANLVRAQLERANLVGAHLEGAILVRANLERARLVGAHFERAARVGAHLKGAYFEAANLGRANLDRAQLEGAILVGANLERANLVGAHLEGAILVRANLERAHLEGANVVGANLEGASLRGARYDDLTTWPTPEFESEARAMGARHVDDDRPGSWVDRLD